MIPPSLPLEWPPRLPFPHAPRISATPDGVGTELSKLLGKLGIHATADCHCKKRVAAMNRRGIEWCEQNRSTIIDWLQEGAAKQSLPFSRWIASRLLSVAIRRSKKAAMP